MSTFFPYLPDWRLARPRVSLSIPATVHEGELPLEQRSSSYDEGDYKTRYSFSYADGPAIRNTLSEGKGSTFWIPNSVEPTIVGIDFASSPYPNAYTGYSGAPISGPLWWADLRLFRTYDETQAFGGLMNEDEYVIRFRSSDKSDYEIKKLIAFSSNFAGLGFFSYQTDSNWSPTVPSDTEYHLMDEVLLVSHQERELTDDKYVHSIVWESIR